MMARGDIGSRVQISIGFDIPEELGWDTLSFVFGPEGPALVAGFRRDLDDRARWVSEGGALYGD